MGKKKDKTDKPEPVAEVDESPYAPIKKRLNYFRLCAVLGILVSLGLLASSIFAVVYSGVKSMAAFEDLPKYQVNSLAIAYRDTVKGFDESMASTQAKLEGEAAQKVLQKSRALSEQLLVSEQAYDRFLSNYAEAMGLAAEQVGGALEWNRYFQADIQLLRDRSAKRQADLQTLFDQFPEPNYPELLQESSTGAANAGARQNSPGSSVKN